MSGTFGTAQHVSFDLQKLKALKDLKPTHWVLIAPNGDAYVEEKPQDLLKVLLVNVDLADIETRLAHGHYQDARNPYGTPTTTGRSKG